TTQVPQLIQSVTPGRAAVIEYEGLPAFQYVHLPVSLFFNVQPDETGVLRMSPEKALLDLLTLQRGTLDWTSIDTGGLNRQPTARLASPYPPRVRQALRASPLADD